jgi:hypothetical protein
MKSAMNIIMGMMDLTYPFRQMTGQHSERQYLTAKSNLVTRSNLAVRFTAIQPEALCGYKRITVIWIWGLRMPIMLTFPPIKVIFY